jgi:hypothetical protein
MPATISQDGGDGKVHDELVRRAQDVSAARTPIAVYRPHRGHSRSARAAAWTVTEDPSPTATRGPTWSCWAAPSEHTNTVKADASVNRIIGGRSRSAIARMRGCRLRVRCRRLRESARFMCPPVLARVTVFVSPASNECVTASVATPTPDQPRPPQSYVQAGCDRCRLHPQPSHHFRRRATNRPRDRARGQSTRCMSIEGHAARHPCTTNGRLTTTSR